MYGGLLQIVEYPNLPNHVIMCWERVRRTINHPALSHARITTFRNTEYVFGSRHNALPDTTMLKNNGIQIHGRLIKQLLTTIIDEVQRILMMDAHLTKFVHVILVGYPIIAGNGEILAVIIENGFFYNKIFTEPIEALEGNHYNGFKVIFVSFSPKKLIIVDPNVATPFNLLSKTPSKRLIIIKSIPLDPCGD